MTTLLWLPNCTRLTREATVAVIAERKWRNIIGWITTLNLKHLIITITQCVPHLMILYFVPSSCKAAQHLITVSNCTLKAASIWYHLDVRLIVDATSRCHCHWKPHLHMWMNGLCVNVVWSGFYCFHIECSLDIYSHLFYLTLDLIFFFFNVMYLLPSFEELIHF